MVPDVSDAALHLERYYAHLATDFIVEDAPEYATLVVPTGNADAPVHRWFHFKEAFSCRLLDQILKDTELLVDRRELRVLDPYAGVGTTGTSLASAVQAGALAQSSIYGIECNEFLHLVSATKLLALQSPPDEFRSFAEHVISRSLEVADSPPIPGLATLNDGRFFEEDTVRQLLRLRQAIAAAEAEGADPVAVALARLAVGASVEAVGNIRRDGRALRYTPKLHRPTVVEAFRRKCRQIWTDLPARPVKMLGRVIRGDGRSMNLIDARFSRFDLVLFSPPYPNNIDYTEVYKLENWVLGFIDHQEAFASQRLRTVYSHPSLLRREPLPAEDLSQTENALIEDLLAPVLAAIPHDRYFEGRRRMVRGYVLDMYRTVRSAARRVRSGGHVVYVVGNSVHGGGHGGFVVAADLLMARLAEYADLNVKRIAVARTLSRRSSNSNFLRESVVFLTPS